MLEYGRRRCCSGVYMVDAENFESIVAELKSEESTSKMRPRCNSASFLSHEKRTSTPTYSASGSTRKQNACQVPLYSSVPVCDNSLRKDMPNKASESASSENHSKSEAGSGSNHHNSTRHQTHYHPQQQQQQQRRKEEKPKDVVLNNARKHVATSITYSSVCSCSVSSASIGPNVVTDMPVKWIKNNLNTRILDIRLHSYQPPQHACKSCIKEKGGHFSYRKISSPLSNSVPHVIPGLSLPQVGNSPNLHSLIHYATGQPILLYDFTEESCPLCQAANSQSHERRPAARRLSQSNTSSSSNPRNHFVSQNQVNRQGHSSFVSSTSSMSSSPQPIDFMDLSSKRTTHPQVNLNVPVHTNSDTKTAYSSRRASGPYEARLCNHPSCTPHTHSGNHHCICRELRCSQSLWSQFFNDSYYCVYYMFPQVPPPTSHPSSVYVDLTEKAFSITIERPFTEEEAKKSQKDSKSHLHSGTSEMTQPKPEYDAGEQSSSRTWFNRPQSSFLQRKPTPHPPASCGPLICMSLPNCKSLESCKTCLVPQPNFMDCESPFPLSLGVIFVYLHIFIFYTVITCHI